MSSRKVKLALVGGGMFGRDVVLRCLADVQRCGLAPYLATAGLDHRARDLAGVEYELVAVGTRTAESARLLSTQYAEWTGGPAPASYSGDAPWLPLLEQHRPEVLFVATPDHLHTGPVLAAIQRGVQVIVEKPLAQRVDEAVEIAERSRAAGVVVAIDLHKRYDSFLRSTFLDVVPQLGDLLYARAVLEEPLEVSTKVFKWADRSNPFTYVGIHWADLFAHFLQVHPRSLHAVGQKRLLVNRRDPGRPSGIDTFDAMQVSVQYDNGMNVQYVNAWINPPDFEGPVNQEVEIVGTRGRVFVDQQDRGLRLTLNGGGTRTRNPHFQAEVPRAALGGSSTSIGYCRDALTAGLEAASRVVLGLADAASLAGSYPDAASQVECVAILEAAAQVAAANHDRLTHGLGAGVTAVFQGSTFTVLDPGKSGDPA